MLPLPIVLNNNWAAWLFWCVSVSCAPSAWLLTFTSLSSSLNWQSSSGRWRSRLLWRLLTALQHLSEMWVENERQPGPGCLCVCLSCAIRVHMGAALCRAPLLLWKTESWWRRGEKVDDTFTHTQSHSESRESPGKLLAADRQHRTTTLIGWMFRRKTTGCMKKTRTAMALWKCDALSPHQLLNAFIYCKVSHLQNFRSAVSVYESNKQNMIMKKCSRLILLSVMTSGTKTLFIRENKTSWLLVCLEQKQTFLQMVLQLMLILVWIRFFLIVFV